MDWLSLLFDPRGFPPRWTCGEWSTPHGWTHIIADQSIALAYVAIPLLLLFFLRKRPDMVMSRLFLLFSAFILFCGTTHLVESIIFWVPLYRLSGALKVITAIVSWATVVALWYAIPQALRYQSPEKLEREVEERTKQLETARANAARSEARVREQNEEMQQLLYAVSHDLRSPLVTLLGYVDVLQEELGSEPDAEVAMGLQAMARSGERMNRRIADLLEVSRLGRLELQRRPLTLRSVVEGVREDLGAFFSDHGAELVVQDDLPKLYADGLRLGQALQNLLRNAVLHGEAKRVEVSAEVRGDEVEVRVRDDGRGIPEEAQARIFRLFERAATSAEGTGIGLAVVEKVAHLHGGTAGVVSAPGEGATFWIRLPQQAPASEAQAT